MRYSHLFLHYDKILLIRDVVFTSNLLLTSLSRISKYLSYPFPSLLVSWIQNTVAKKLYLCSTFMVIQIVK